MTSTTLSTRSSLWPYRTRKTSPCHAPGPALSRPTRAETMGDARRRRDYLTLREERGWGPEDLAGLGNDRNGGRAGVPGLLFLVRHLSRVRLLMSVDGPLLV